MEKRVLIAVLLSIAVMYGYSFLFPQQKSMPQKPVPTQGTVSPDGVQPAPAPVPAQLSVGGSSQPTLAKDITVENDLFSVVISTKNGAIKKFVLKKYMDQVGKDGKAIELFDQSLLPGSGLQCSYPGLLPNTDIVYQVNANSLTLTGSERKSLELTYQAENGISVRKVFTFTGNGYQISLDQTVSNNSSQQMSGQVQMNLLHPAMKPKSTDGRFEVYGPVTFSDSAVAFDSLSDLAKNAKSYTKGVKWSGFGDKYFLSAVAAKDTDFASVALKEQGGILSQSFTLLQANIAPGSAVTTSVNLFFGPKDIDILKAQSVHLEEAIDLGWFSAIAKPLLHSLKLFYRYLHNYGLAIIVITVILKILFFPLTHKSYKSMKQMQKLQPKMQELKEKFKDDRDGLNRAVMELYKTHKVNPLGGCLPMLVQIPVFFGLYKALMFSIELRHAPFYFWLQDLSAKDPYYVTPIIMGVTMFIQQKMTPTNVDPVQAKVMLALPVVFTFMFLSFPSGLVLYWLVNNILTIAQQAYINKTLTEA